MGSITPRSHLVLVMLLSGVLASLPHGQVFGGGGDSPAMSRVLIPPELPCGIRTMTGFDHQIYLLGKCGTVARWNPFSGEFSILVLDDQVNKASGFSVTHDRIAVLTDRGHTIRIYDWGGSFLSEYQYSGESQLWRIALTPNGVLASSYFDDNILLLFTDNQAEPIRLVQNPYYWPDLNPRFASFVDVYPLKGKVAAFDLTDYAIYVVDPETGYFSTTQKEPHPWWREYSKPESHSNKEGVRYTGERLAVSSALANDEVYVLWVDRSLIRGEAEMDDGYAEIAVGRLTEKDWKTVVRMGDFERYGGCGNLAVIGQSIFCINPKGVVHEFQIAGD